MEIIDGPRIVAKPEVPCLGIRLVTPFRGMLAVRDTLLEELYGWLAGHAITETGNMFFRLHVIDMEGPMDLEVGVITDRPLDGDDRVRPSVLPAGNYASLTYVNHARRANKTLIDWCRANDVAFDRSDVPEGDRFGCRYEEYLTDPRTERMKTKWRIGLNIRVAD
jgi:hypothetical protein